MYTSEDNVRVCSTRSLLIILADRLSKTACNHESLCIDLFVGFEFSELAG